jgi:hypothetical protein
VPLLKIAQFNSAAASYTENLTVCASLKTRIIIESARVHFAHTNIS